MSGSAMPDPNIGDDSGAMAFPESTTAYTTGPHAHSPHHKKRHRGTQEKEQSSGGDQ
jgi:hypothetical protein